MAVLVEHDKRRHEILEKSLELFIEEGYEDVTFQKIADRCGITRTTLYIYFKNKREIFLWSIKQLLSSLEIELLNVISNQELNSVECLEKIFSIIMDSCEQNTQLFKVLLSYLMQLQKSGISAGERVTRRVIRLQHLLSTVIIRGQKKGELKKLPVKEINNVLYCLIESTIFHVAVLGVDKLSENRAVINSYIKTLSLLPEKN